MDYENGENRLTRMRESQRKLRIQRKQELEVLKEQNQKLINEKEQLQREQNRLKDEFSLAFSLFDDEITSGQLEKLVTDIDLADYTEQYELMPLDDFIRQGKFENHPCLFMNGKFILQEICNKSLSCLNRALTTYSSVAIKDTPFRFVKSSGLGVLKYHIDTMRIVVKQSKVPRDWLNDDKILPKGALSIVEVLNYVSSHTALKTLNSYILCVFMSRFSFATNQGLAMFEHDLLRCIEYAQSSNFDEAYLLGTIDEKLCPTGVLPKSLV